MQTGFDNDRPSRPLRNRERLPARPPATELVHDPRGPAGAGTPLAAARAARRLAGVGAQTLGPGALWACARRSGRATRVLATGLCLGGAAAFAMHIAVSVRTRSVMPGLATSLVPGLPGAALTLCAIWARA